MVTPNKNLIFTEYQTRVSFVADSYLNKYLQQVAKEKRTIDTAGEFVKTHDTEYRNAIAGIGVDMLHNQLNKEVQEIVLENNKWAISKLFVEVMNASIDKPLFGTEI